MARICPMCGNRMPRADMDNALSRYQDVYICKDCGNNEAMRDFHGIPQMKPYEWYANPFLLIESNDGVLFDDDFDENGYIIPKWDPRYRGH